MDRSNGLERKKYTQKKYENKHVLEDRLQVFANMIVDRIMEDKRNGRLRIKKAKG